LTALEAALSQNPHLTSLPSPKPSIIPPADLDLTTGTAEIFRLPEVRDAITGDFIILPCDLVCELNGSSLLETWMAIHGGLGGATGGNSSFYGKKMSLDGEQSGRRGGLGVWYQTKDGEGGVGVKHEETDFLATTELEASTVPPHAKSLRPSVRNVVMSMPTAVLKDVVEEKQSLHVRYALLRKFGKVRTLATHRDAHLYFFPYWVKDFIQKNEDFESLGEDVLSWWAKAGWQDGLAEKLAIDEVLDSGRYKKITQDADFTDDIDIASLSSTYSKKTPILTKPTSEKESFPSFASRVRSHSKGSENSSPTNEVAQEAKSPTVIPRLLSYIHSSLPAQPLIRRTDTVPLLLSVSLRLARQASIEESSASSQSASPFAHIAKVAESSPVPTRSTVTRADTIIDANAIISEKTAIKECVIGTGCVIQSGARLTRCLLMEGAVVEEKAVLTGCVIGRRAVISKEAELRDCTVQEGYVVPKGAVGKGEIFAGFDERALSDESERDDDDDDGEDGQGSDDAIDDDNDF